VLKSDAIAHKWFCQKTNRLLRSITPHKPASGTCAATGFPEYCDGLEPEFGPGITSCLSVIQAQSGVCSEQHEHLKSRRHAWLEALVYSVGYPEARMEIAATVPSDLPRKLGLIDALRS